MTSGFTDQGTHAAEQARWPSGEIAAHGPVHLDVTDGERSLLFWRDVLGLEVIRRNQGQIEVGAGRKVLLVLHPGAQAGFRPGHTGLYHVAVHVPDAAEFAYVLARLSSAHYPNNPTEHLFSKATYLNDLDGIGVEITFETPERVKEVRLHSGRAELIDQGGNSHSPVGHLDLEETMSHLESGQAERPLKAGTWIGHIHLHVSDLEKARHFYSGLLGFPVGLDTPGVGMLDVHFLGEFKHRIAFNAWNGPAAQAPPAGTAGLRYFTLVLKDRATLDSTLEKLEAGGYPSQPSDEGPLVHDSAGNSLLLVSLPD